jgi:hypothetical protein
MSEFVDECRREWRRLGVADPIANEMAADLTADLDEAEAEGDSLEDVLGNSAFDPRRFAAAWATSRGVVGMPTRDYSPSWRKKPVVAAIACMGVLLVFLAGLVLLVGRSSRSIAIAPVAIRRFANGLLPIRLALPVPRIVVPSPPNLPMMRVQIAGVSAFHPLALFLLVAGMVGIVFVGCAVLFWSRWSRSPRSSRRDHESPNPRVN